MNSDRRWRSFLIETFGIQVSFNDRGIYDVRTRRGNIMIRKINMFLLICLIVSFMTILIPSNVYACYCAESLTVEAQLSHSEAVFSGHVLEVKDVRNLNGSMTKSILFEINEIWKGGSESQIIIHTGSGGGDCGFYFEEGKEYLVYAQLSKMYGDKEQLVTIMCDRTNSLSKAREDLAILGEGRVPIDQVSLENELDRKQTKVPTEQVILENEHRMGIYVWVTALGFVAIVVMAYIVWRKMRK